MNSREAPLDTMPASICHADAGSLVRRKVLRERTPAPTIIIVDIHDEGSLLELEALAAA